MLDRTATILAQVCGLIALGGLAGYALREVWLRLRARGLESRVEMLRELLQAGGTEARVWTMLRRRPTAHHDLEALEHLLEERRRTLPADASPEQLAAHYASYDELGIVERHVQRLEGARSWAERAFSARFLGEIGNARAVEPLVRVLRNTREEDRDVRLAAGRALGRIRDPRAVEPLLDALAAPESWLPARIAEVVLQFGPLAFEPLLARLEDSDNAAVRAWAAEILGDLGDTKATPSLLACLADLNEGVRARAASALGKLRDRRAVPELIRMMLADPVPYVRIQVVRALGAISDPRALHHLIDALKDGEWWVRIRVVEALEQLGEPAIEPLYMALDDPDVEVRARAALTLERLGVLDELVERLSGVDPSARAKLLAAGLAGVVEVLVGALAHPDARVRFIITEILGEVRHPSVAAALVVRLDAEPDTRIVGATVHALALQEEASAAVPILKLLGHADERVRVEAVHALESIRVADPHALLASAVRDHEPRVRAGAATVLGTVGDANAVPALVELTADGDAAVRAAAARSLGLLADEAAVPRLIEATQDADATVQRAAVRALGQIGDPAALMPLVRLLEHASDELGAALAWSLGRIRCEDSEDLIDVLFQGDDRSSRLGALATLVQRDTAPGRELVRAMLADAEPDVVAEAARILGRLGERAAAAEVVGLLESPIEDVRLAALEALIGIGDTACVPALRAAVRDPSPAVRARALLGLSVLGDEASGDLLRQTLAQVRSTTLRAAALLALLVLDREEDRGTVLDALLTVPLFEFVSDRRRADDPVLRAAVAAARRSNGVAMQFATATSREQLVETLVHDLGSDPHPEHRVRILQTLGARHSAEAYPAVWRTFRKDPSPAVRVAALRVLATTAPADEFARALADALEDPQPELRAEALRRLGTVPPEQATPLLLSHLENGSPEAREALIESLAALPASHLEAFLDAAMGSELGVRAREVMIQVLGRTPHLEARPLLDAYMEALEPELRSASLHALGAVPGGHAADLVAAALSDPNAGVRLEATHAAAALGKTRGAPILRQALGDPEPAVRRQALLHLARLRAAGVQDDLRAACSDPESGVRAAALAGIALTGRTPVETWIGPRDVPAITAALRDLMPAEECIRQLANAREPVVRLGALRALFLGDATSRAAALAAARRDPAPEVRTAGRHLESVLETWLQEPGARGWLEGAPPEAAAETKPKAAKPRSAAKPRRAPRTEVKR